MKRHLEEPRGSQRAGNPPRPGELVQRVVEGGSSAGMTRARLKPQMKATPGPPQASWSIQPDAVRVHVLAPGPQTVQFPDTGDRPLLSRVLGRVGDGPQKEALGALPEGLRVCGQGHVPHVPLQAVRVVLRAEVAPRHPLALVGVPGPEADG